MNITIKILLVQVVLFTATTCMGQKYKGDTWAKVKVSGGTLTAIYYEQPGLIVKDPTTGKMKGICVDIMEDFVKFVRDKYGKNLLVDYAGKDQVFPSFLSTIQNTPNIMGVTSIIVTEERKKILKFTPPFLTNPVVMITHKDVPNISNTSEIATILKGYTAKVINGSAHVDLAKKIKKEHNPSLSIEYANSGGDILHELSKGGKLWTILEFTELYSAAKEQLPVKRHSVSFGKDVDLAFIMSKQTDWDTPWNEFMTDEYKKSIRYRKIIADNLGASFLSLIK